MKRWISSHRHLSSQDLSFRGDGQWTSLFHVSHLVNQTPPLRLIYVALTILSFGIVILTCNVYQLQTLPNQRLRVADRAINSSPRNNTDRQIYQPTVWIYGKRIETGYLDHVIAVFRRVGYNVVFGPSQVDWDVLWTHDYPFIDMRRQLTTLKPHQKVNHFPGSGYLTNKVNLATSNSPYIPTAFKIPNDKDAFLDYQQDHPTKLFVQKNNKHRGITLQSITSLNLTQDGSFIQEFIQNPLLIDKRKFDVGVYTIITSIDPLRVYIYSGDALLRFCSADYAPFNSKMPEKYVVDDNYTPIWEMPSLKRYYQVLGYTMKESFNAYLISKKINPELIWSRMESAIREVIIEKEPKLMLASTRYRSSRNFYEMVRFDFTVSTDLKVYIMEANMSPNLATTHFVQNKLLYEQVIFNTLSLTGIASLLHVPSRKDRDAANMRVSVRDLTVNAASCHSDLCRLEKNCHLGSCQLCLTCLDETWIQILLESYREHLFKHNCRRIIPPTTLKNTSTGRQLSPSNSKLLNWFKEKCSQDITFC